MSENSQTIAQLRRKVARLEAQLKSLENFMQRCQLAEMSFARQGADAEMRIKQALAILSGTDL